MEPTKDPKEPKSTAATEIGTPVRLNEHSMHTLRASLKELQRDMQRKLSTPLFMYFTNLYKECFEGVQAGSAPWHGEWADLRWYQDKLRAIPGWNADQIKQETHKILKDIPDWPASDVVGTVMYLKAMILASIRPSDIKDDIFIPIASIETYLHTCMRIIAKKLFAHPSLLRRFPDDDEETIDTNTDRIYSDISSAIDNAVTDLVPTAEIVQKYLARVIQNVKRDSRPRPIDEAEKYAFQDRGEVPEDDESMSEATDEESLTDGYSDTDSDYEDSDVHIPVRDKHNPVHKPVHNSATRRRSETSEPEPETKQDNEDIRPSRSHHGRHGHHAKKGN